MKCECSIRVIVLLEWLTALEYLDLSLQALNKQPETLHLKYIRVHLDLLTELPVPTQ